MINKPNIYAVMMKKAARAKERAFIVTEKKVDWMEGCFHCYGFWTDSVPEETTTDVEASALLELWIPWQNIDYIKSLLYKRGA